LKGGKLIDYGRGLAERKRGELHILHIENGSSVFRSGETAGLLQDLFGYAAGFGGIIHAVCADDVLPAFKRTARENYITDIVLGETPEPLNAFAEGAQLSFAERLQKSLPNVSIHIVSRNGELCRTVRKERKSKV
jgi:K+-sensing histidine kinase KdpD